MITTILNRVRHLQRNRYKDLGFSESHTPQMGMHGAPEHNPEMLLIGCVDARLDPHADIGIPNGKALIYRNIAALVAGRDGGAGDRLSVAAALEFAVKRMQVQKIVVMGHTACGGIRAFLQGDNEDTHYIHDYLMPLEQVRLDELKKGVSEEEQARAMEKAAVLFSLENLLTYDVVSEAVAAGKLRLHGWLLDTGNKLIWERDATTGHFYPIGSKELE